MSTPGWHTDPTGRFGQRLHDGNDWTDLVVGADGQQTYDPYPRSQPTAAQPAAPTWASMPVASGVAGVGALLVVLCLVVLDWVEDGSFSDVRKGWENLPAGAELDVAANLEKVYALWLGYALAALVVIAVGALIVTRRQPGPGVYVLVASVAGVAAVYHTFVVVHAFRGPVDPDVPAWLATVGYLALIAAAAIRARGDT